MKTSLKREHLEQITTTIIEGRIKSQRNQLVVGEEKRKKKKKKLLINPRKKNHQTNNNPSKVLRKSSKTQVKSKMMNKLRKISRNLKGKEKQKKKSK
jgi:hypothetical protein